MYPSSNTSTIADLEKVLIDAPEIDQRLQVLGQEISQHYQDKELTVISVINGAIIFTADLIRQIKIPLMLESLRVSSYQNSCAPQTEPALFDAVTLELKGSHVLIIDDILDSGRTLSAVMQHLQSKQPASLKTCVLLDKMSHRDCPMTADFVGFKIPDAFVVGYGLDYAQRYRQLPCIGILKPECYQATAQSAANLDS
jgi:hypoxanthine phosphoribosyltransferase